MIASAPPREVQVWPIERLILYARNPRKNDAAVDRMCASIREFGFKIPVLPPSDGEVVDGRLRGWQKFETCPDWGAKTNPFRFNSALENTPDSASCSTAAR